MNASPTTGATSRRLATVAVCLLVFSAVVLGYAGYTGQVWEDYLITFRYSRNLAEGRGLVYNPGERVHGFTSPLGTLVPAGLYALSGRSEAAALALFRACSALAFAGGGLLLVGACLREPGPWPLVSAGGLALLYATDAKGVAFSANGMETGFVLLFAAWGLWLVRRPGADPWRWRGLVWAGLLWTRPDGCVHAAALALAELAFGATPRRRLPASWAKSGLVCALVYGPWLAAAWAYFGSPIPNTAAAKATYIGGTYGEYFRRTLASFPAAYVQRSASVFAPIYYTSFQGWPLWVLYGCIAAAAWASLYWLVPVADALGRAASLCFALLCLYMTAIPALFPWYLPPVAMFGVVALARGVPRVAFALGRGGLFSAACAAAVLGALVAGSGALLALTAYQAHVQQEVIEDGNRKQIGLWLAEHANPWDLVYTEPLGYVGYYSGCVMADYPGLVTPRVVRLRRQHNLDFVSVIFELQPDWIVARPEQARDMRVAGLAPAYYRRAEAFDVGPLLERYGYLPGRAWFEYDSKFVLFRRVGRG